MIDFREPGPVGKVLRWFGQFAGKAGPFSRVAAVVGTLFIAAIGVEVLRVHAAWQGAVRWELERDRLSQQLVLLEQRSHAQMLEQRTLVSLLQIRSTNAHQAVRLAMLGNAIGPHAGLLSLHRAADGIEVEGRARTVDDVAFAIDRLQRSESASQTTFALKRDDSGSGYVWFRLGLKQ